jgi:hypothetical protein
MILLCCICWVLGEYGSSAAQLPPPQKASTGQVRSAAFIVFMLFVCYIAFDFFVLQQAAFACWLCMYAFWALFFL